MNQQLYATCSNAFENLHVYWNFIHKTEALEVPLLLQYGFGSPAWFCFGCCDLLRALKPFNTRFSITLVLIVAGIGKLCPAVHTTKQCYALSRASLNWLKGIWQAFWLLFLVREHESLSQAQQVDFASP
ncbi:hypothetical protein HZ326_8969 [Fusarium oxysporum f. sp. albedinis]|nr:hypothetical protein HZ326_8969 [Fusarium oxysporum f. sp. albedinis]